MDDQRAGHPGNHGVGTEWHGIQWSSRVVPSIVPTPSRRPGNLPAEATSFIGRRHELADARRKLTTARLVSLVGPGGVGKTRLAMRIATDLARSFPDGVWLVELAELRDPALVGHTVLAGLDLRDQLATEPMDRLRSYLRDRELLLVVDNCEHLVDAAAHLIADLLRSAPGVRNIATSREPLSVPGEHVLPVPPLPLPAPGSLPASPEPIGQLRENEAVRLFVERSAAASGQFELTPANQAAVVDLCRRLDGLPLAIELAAVRTRVLSADQILDRLSRRFELLTGAGRAALPRHQTLHTTIEWSYDLLTPAERTLLARLSVFAGRFTLDDVEPVCCFDDVPSSAALNLVSSLLDKSLVSKEDNGAVTGYRLHETMREYARLKLSEQDGSAILSERYVDHYLTRCLRFAAEGRFRLLDWLAWMELEIDNVRSILRRCVDHRDTERGIALATALIWYWITRATTEGVRWLDELLPMEPRDGSGVVTTPWAYFVRGFLAVLQADPVAATPVLDRGIAVARVSGPPSALSQLLAMASIATTMSGDRSRADQFLHEARDIAADANDVSTILMTYQARALNALHVGDLDTARLDAAEGARLSHQAGDLYSLDMMLMNWGFAALRSGDVGEAEQRFTEALPIAHRLDDRVAQCYLLGGLGACAAATRGQARAAQLLGAMERLRIEVGATVNVGMAPALRRATNDATRALGPARFESEFRAGHRLNREAAVRLALRESASPAANTSYHDSGSALGAREVDVAKLVAEGLTNKEIGARLFISDRTVETHVRNILSKLGFQSRAQIARWMADAGH